MPLRFIPPCSPIRASKPPVGEEWVHELKLDGYRLQVVKDGRQVQLYSRRGFDWTRRLVALVEALTAIPCGSAVIDAELVYPAHDGAPDFAGLQAAMKPGRQHELAVPARVFALGGRYHLADGLGELRLEDERGPTDGLRDGDDAFSPDHAGRLGLLTIMLGREN